MAEEDNKVQNFSVVQPKWKILLAGATAGLVVDATLFPLDTVKSRLQSKLGFRQSGGFFNLYRGIQPVLAGSVPSAALFFITYETVKEKLETFTSSNELHYPKSTQHILAAATGETISCIARVPYEVVKTRSQTNVSHNFSSLNLAKDIFAKDGFRGIYRGFFSTLARDIPFSALQFPIWEGLKSYHTSRYRQSPSAIESALYGCVAGAISAFATTPLDVAKTRIMLADRSEKLAGGNVIVAMIAVGKEKGVAGLFAGVVPRVIWISSGAAIFLGTYELAISTFWYR